MAIKILANDGIGQNAITLFEKAGYEVELHKIPQEELASRIHEYDAIIIRSATKLKKDVLDAGKNLKIIARAGVGLDNIDVAYAESKGIKVVNTPNASTHSVAELTMGHIYTLARKLNLSNREMPLKGMEEFKMLKKAYSSGFEINDKKLGIIGMGNIGKSAATLAYGNGMYVIPVDSSKTEVDIKIAFKSNNKFSLFINIPIVPLEEMLPKADFISLHVPYSGGKPIIGEQEIKQMKNGVMLINTSRGGAINEDALLKGLKSGKIAGAALDVYTGEPTPREELLSHPNVSITPHIGGSTIEAQHRVGMEVANQILDFFKK